MGRSGPRCHFDSTCMDDINEREILETPNDHSRISLECVVKLRLDHLVVGANGDGWKVNVPDGVGCVRNAGQDGAVLPLGVDRLDENVGQDDSTHKKKEPQDS